MKLRLQISAVFLGLLTLTSVFQNCGQMRAPASQTGATASLSSVPGQNAGSCVAGATQSCAVTNGSGSQTCLADGSTWGSCTLSSCNSGYTLSGGSCVSQSSSAAPNPTPTPTANTSPITNISQATTVTGNYQYTGPVPTLTGTVPAHTAICAAGGTFYLGSPTSTTSFPVMTVYDFFELGTLSLDVNVDLASQQSAQLKTNEYTSSQPCPVSAFSQAVTYLNVTADLNISGDLIVTGLMYIAAGATVTVGSGKITLGPGNTTPGIIWIDQGGKLILANNQSDSIGDQNGDSGYGLVLSNEATIQVGL